MKQQDSAFVCFSGGQDSTTCLFWAKKHFSHVEAVCFTYGQKHSLEVKVAQKIAEDAQVPFHLLDVSLISQLDPNCSLVNDQIPMELSQYVRAGAQYGLSDLRRYLGKKQRDF